MREYKNIAFYGLSDMGRQRNNNEDAFAVEQLDENTILAVVIDGVGGYEGGEVAAAIAQSELLAYMKAFNRGERIQLLKQAVISANNAIFEQRKIDTARPNMSCVLTAVVIDRENKTVNMVHVGDTRLYQYYQGTLKKLSHDHSLVGYREEIGDITEEEAMHHPQRNVISRDVGSAHHDVDDQDFLEAEQFPLLPDSLLLLCSDGLTDLVTSAQITAILQRNTSIEEKTKALIDAANNAGGKDNVTVVLVECNDGKAENHNSTAGLPVMNTIKLDVPNGTKPRKPRKKLGIWVLNIAMALLFFAAGGYTAYRIIDNVMDGMMQYHISQEERYKAEIDSLKTLIQTDEALPAESVIVEDPESENTHQEN